jgi:uncharacterized lipoprotein
MKRTVAVVFAVLSLALLVGGCSKSKQLEDKMAEVLQSQLQAKNVKVTCPGDVKAKKGDEVECTATGDFSALGSDATSVKFHVTFPEDNNFLIDNATPLNGSSAGSGGTSSSDTSSSTSSDTLPGGDDTSSS